MEAEPKPMTFKPGDLVRIKRKFNYVLCVNTHTSDWTQFNSDQVGLYLEWNCSKRSGADQQAVVLIGEHKCYVFENDIELVTVKE